MVSYSTILCRKYYPPSITLTFFLFQNLINNICVGLFTFSIDICTFFFISLILPWLLELCTKSWSWMGQSSKFVPQVLFWLSYVLLFFQSSDEKWDVIHIIYSIDKACLFLSFCFSYIWIWHTWVILFLLVSNELYKYVIWYPSIPLETTQYLLFQIFLLILGEPIKVFLICQSVFISSIPFQHILKFQSFC